MTTYTQLHTEALDCLLAIYYAAQVEYEKYEGTRSYADYRGPWLYVASSPFDLYAI